ncbi:MAG: putative wall-associated protein, partial [Gammaproteobacteria bacterium]
MNSAAFASLPSSACVRGAEVGGVQDRITRSIYDNVDQVTTVQRAVDTPLQQDYVTYTYLAGFANYGKPATVRDANGNVSAMEYGGSVFNHITKLTFPSPTTAGQTNPADFESYTYDANGNRTQLRKRDGQLINYSIDALNRVTLMDVGGAATAGDVYYGYDLRGL